MAVPYGSVVCDVVESVFMPMRLIFHGIVHIVRLECDLFLHGNLQERQEDFYQVEIGCEITEYLLDFVKHLGGLCAAVVVAVKHVVDDEQNSKSCGGFEEDESVFTQSGRGKHSQKGVLLDAGIHLNDDAFGEVLFQRRVAGGVMALRQVVGIHARVVAYVVNRVGHYLPQ